VIVPTTTQIVVEPEAISGNVKDPISSGYLTVEYAGKSGILSAFVEEAPTTFRG